MRTAGATSVAGRSAGTTTTDSDQFHRGSGCCSRDAAHRVRSRLECMDSRCHTLRLHSAGGRAAWSRCGSCPLFPLCGCVVFVREVGWQWMRVVLGLTPTICVPDQDVHPPEWSSGVGASQIARKPGVCACKLLSCDELKGQQTDSRRTHTHALRQARGERTTPTTRQTG